MVTGLPRAPVERLLKEASKKRVSKKATEQMARILEDFIEDVAEDAAIFCKHAGRKTITDEDILLAMKDWK
ncbi:MAG: histone family protein [Candidatus Micrarchaeota archaeon]|nr:histone family protein [Candidatus Micrarchaeota archaeon]